jgi:cobalt/nickel transport system permease protein
MHVPDGILSPAVAAVTGGIAALGFGYGVTKVERELGGRSSVLMAMVASFVFAAQMVNFPVAFGVSGHLIGGVLAAVTLGPWGGLCVVAAVLIVQCLLFGDGGLTALGANLVNMGIIGSIGGYYIYAAIRRTLGGRRGVLIGGMLAAWFSVILAAAALAVELGASGHRGFPRILGWLVLVHAAIGVGEAFITGLVLRLLLLARPDMIHRCSYREAPLAVRWGQNALAGLGIALAIAVFLAPFASQYPDGLEYVGSQLGFVPEQAAPPVFHAPIPEYELRTPLTVSLGVATALAGAVGTLVVFALGLTLGRIFSAATPKALTTDVP